jgi:hypothetical protein
VVGDRDTGGKGSAGDTERRGQLTSLCWAEDRLHQVLILQRQRNTSAAPTSENLQTRM